VHLGTIQGHHRDTFVLFVQQRLVLGHEPSYLMATGFTGLPSPPTNGCGDASRRNS
jgi:hypothetical protein